MTSKTITYGGRREDVDAYQILAGDNNRNFPLTCGHRHVTGDLVFEHPDRDLVLCTRCVDLPRDWVEATA